MKKKIYQCRCLANRAVSLLLILLLSASFLCQVHADTKDDKDKTASLIDQLIHIYGTKQEAGQKEIDDILTDLKAVDSEVGAAWENIMDFWTYANTEMDVPLGVVPENFPSDDSLCVVILGKKLADDGTMTEELIGRLDLGLAIADAYPDSYIAVTGGGTADNNPDVTEGGLMGEYLLEKGLSEERLIVEDSAPDTVGNAENTFHILKEKYPSVNSIVILTSDYHVPRGCILFHSRFVLEALEKGTEPLKIVAGVGFYTGEESYESFELQARGVRSIAENCGYVMEETEEDMPVEGILIVAAAGIIGVAAGVILAKKYKKKRNK